MRMLEENSGEDFGLGLCGKGESSRRPGEPGLVSKVLERNMPYLRRDQNILGAAIFGEL